MNTKKLITKFSSALQWNSIFYAVYKVCFVTLSFTLYKTLSPGLFSTWAMGNSLVFLSLLWLDCGFRKSIPRYCPEFAKNQKAHKHFIYLVLCIQSIVLLLALTPLYKVLPYFVKFKHLTFYVLAIFVINGVAELMRVIYHAHFWQKPFNTLQMSCVLAEMTGNFYFILFYPPNCILVERLLVAKIASGCALLAGSAVMLPTLLRDRNYPGNQKIDIRKQTKAFIEHSIVMWATTCIKSLSERNFLFPFLTNTLGAPAANLFKVTHDSALFFQRISIRILGNADTALLAHIQVYSDTRALYSKAFIRLFKTVSALCIPLLYIGILVFIKKHQSVDDQVLYMFFVVAVGYMLEVLLSPYARMLEVKRRYSLLWLSYAPYIAGFGFLLFTKAPRYMSLLWFMSAVHALRLIGSFLMAYFAQKHYPMPFPRKFIAIVILVSAGASLCIWLLI